VPTAAAVAVEFEILQGNPIAAQLYDYQLFLSTKPPPSQNVSLPNFLFQRENEKYTMYVIDKHTTLCLFLLLL
jgi:hypothetical protein